MTNQELEEGLAQEGYRLVVERDIADGKEMRMLVCDFRRGIDQLNIKHNSTLIKLTRHASANGIVYFECVPSCPEKKCEYLGRTLKIAIFEGIKVSYPICLIFIVPIE